MKVAPADIIPESNFVAPAGTVNEVTVCETVSLFVQVTVLFTPMITVRFSGAYPGAALGPVPAPLGIETETPLVAALL